MASEKEVIKEFLVSLGFQVQPVGLNKFKDVLGSIDNAAFRTGKNIIGLGVAAEALVGIFARNMEKLFYASQRTKSSVEGLQALRFAAGQVGVEADEAAGALESMSGILRTQPGARALIEQLLGEPSANKENLELLYGLILKLKGMPHEIGAQFASMFGLDERTFFMLKSRIEELMAADQKRRQMTKEAGLDPKGSSETAREYMNTLREVWERVGILSQKTAEQLLPTFREINKLVLEALDGLTKWVGSDKAKTLFSGWRLELMAIAEGIEGISGMWSAARAGDAKAFARALLKAGEALMMESPSIKEAARKMVEGDKPPLSSGSVGGYQLAQQMVALGMLKRHYNTAELSGEEMSALENEIRETELRIRALKSQGFVPSGVNAPGALRMMEEGAGGGGVVIHQKTDINVTSNDATSAGKAVASEQKRVNADLVRNATGAVR